MFRPRIRTICNCSAHLFPVRMRFGGTRNRYGRLVYVMYCPVSGLERIYIYTRFGRIRRVA